jgi:VWFA-related protein
MKDGDRAALVTFSHVVSPALGLTGNFDRVRAALDNAQGSGLTALIDASHAGMLMGESDVGRSLLLLFSDGVDTASWLTAESVLETARRGDVVVYAVEVGGRRPEFTRQLSEATGGRLITIESTKDLSSTFAAILEEFRMRYLISYSPDGVKAPGWHRLEVRVRGRGYTVRARPGYFAGS